MFDQAVLEQLLAVFGIAAILWGSLWGAQRQTAKMQKRTGQSPKDLVLLPRWVACLCGNPMRDGHVEPMMAMAQLLMLTWFVETVILVIAIPDFQLRTTIISLSFLGMFVIQLFGSFAIRWMLRRQRSGE